MTPAAKDRRMQVHLAQARGLARNGELLCQAIDLMLAIKRSRETTVERPHVENALVETLSAVATALDESGAAYAVTGSIASSIHGEPITSLDVDLVIVASRAQAQAIAHRLGPRFYAPVEMLTQAAAENGFANVVDNVTGFKADLSFIDPKGYPGSVIARRIRQRIGKTGPEFWFVTAEDVILMKLLWRKDTQSSKQWENALSVARVKAARMDWKYLWERAAELGIQDDLTRLRDEAGI